MDSQSGHLDGRQVLDRRFRGLGFRLLCLNGRRCAVPIGPTLP